MEWPFIWTNLNIHYLKILYAKFLWSRWRRKFLKIVNFLLFHFYRTLEQGLSFSLTNWNPLYPKMFVPCLVEIVPVVLEEKIFWYGLCILFSPPKKWCLLTQKFVWNYPMYCFICRGFIVFTHLETSRLPVKGCKFWPMLGTHGHEQWGFFSVPHLLWHGASVFNGHLRGPVTLTPIAERSAVELSRPVFTT